MSDNQSLFFSGNIVDAVNTSEAERRPLVVFLADSGEDSLQAERSLMSDVVKDLLKQMKSVCLKLQDDLSSTAAPEYKDARALRAVYPTEQLPTVFVVGLNGSLILTIKSQWTPDAMASNLAKAKHTFDEQMKARFLAETFRALATYAQSQQPQTPGAGATATTQQPVAAPPAPGTTRLPAPTVAAVASPPTGTHPNQLPASNPTAPSVPPPPQPAAAAPAASSQLPRGSPAAAPISRPAAPISRPHQTPSAAAQPSVKPPTAIGQSGQPSQSADVAQGDASKLPSSQVIYSSSVGAPRRPPAVPMSDSAAGNGVTGQDLKSLVGSVKTVVPPRPLPPVRAPTKASLQFRLTNGDSLREEFPADTPLHVIRNYLDVHRTDGGVPYLLVVPYPKRVLSREDLDKTLLDLDLAPRTTLILEPVGGGHSHMGHQPLSQTTMMSRFSTGGGVSAQSWGSYVWDLLPRVWSYINPAGYFPPTQGPSPTPGPSSSSAPQHQPPSGATSAAGGGVGGGGYPDITSGTTTIRRRAGAGNVYGLHHASSDKDPSKNNSFWNGNSTQFNGGDDK